MRNCNLACDIAKKYMGMDTRIEKLFNCAMIMQAIVIVYVKNASSKHY